MSLVPVMRLLNFWPPLFFCGIHVVSFDHEMRNIEVELRLRQWNRNANGTQFGGNIYAMTDPFYPLMLMANLGKNYVVWDESAHIDFIKPGRTSLRARFHLDDEKLAAIRDETAGDKKYLAEFLVEITDASKVVVATVQKVIYIRPKQLAQPAPVAEN